MKLILILFLFSIEVSTQNTIELTENPINESYLSHSEFLTLDGGEQGYYNSVSAKYFDSKFYLFDQGNRKLYIYDMNGKELLNFGKEGNGPGEISRMQTFDDVKSNRIIFGQWDKCSIFDLNGNFIREIKLHMPAYRRVITAKTIEFISLPNRNEESIVFDLNGNKIKTMAKENSVFRKNKRIDIANVKEKIVAYLKPSDWTFLNGNLYRHSNLEYQIDIADNNEKIIKSYTRPFDRVEFHMSEDWTYLIISDKKKQAMLNAKYREELKSARGGYEADINRILGLYQSDLYVEVNSSNESTVLIDVISNDKFMDQISIRIPKGISLNGRTLLNDNYIICHFTSDETGPFSKIYRINLN